MPIVDTYNKITGSVSKTTCSEWTTAENNANNIQIILKRKLPVLSSSQTTCQDKIPTQSSMSGGDDDENLFVRIKRWRHSQNAEAGTTRSESSEMIPLLRLQQSSRDSGIDVGSPIRQDADCTNDVSASDVDGCATMKARPTLGTAAYDSNDDCIIVEESDSSSDCTESRYRTIDRVKSRPTTSPRCLFTTPAGQKLFLSTRHGQDCFQSMPSTSGPSQPVSISSSETSCIIAPTSRRSVETLSRSSSETSCIVLDEPPTRDGWENEPPASMDVDSNHRIERNLFEFIAPKEELEDIASSSFNKFNDIVALSFNKLNDIVTLFNKTNLEDVTVNRPIGLLPNWKSKLKLNSCASVSSTNVTLEPCDSSQIANNSVIINNLSGTVKSDSTTLRSYTNSTMSTMSTSDVTSSSCREPVNLPIESQPQNVNFSGAFANFLSTTPTKPDGTRRFPVSMINALLDNNAAYKCRATDVSLQKDVVHTSPSNRRRKSSNNFGNAQNIFLPSSDCEPPLLLPTVPLGQQRTVDVPFKYVLPSKSQEDLHSNSLIVVSGDILPSSCSISVVTTGARSDMCALVRRKKSSLSFYNKTSRTTDAVVTSSLTKCTKRPSTDRGVLTGPTNSFNLTLTEGVKPVLNDSVKTMSCEFSKMISTAKCILTTIESASASTRRGRSTKMKCNVSTSVEYMELDTPGVDRKQSLIENVYQGSTDGMKIVSTNFAGSPCAEYENLTSSKSIQPIVPENSNSSEILHKQISQDRFQISRNHRQSLDTWQVSPERGKRKRSRQLSAHQFEIDNEPTRKTARKPCPNTRYVNDWSWNDNMIDETELPEPEPVAIKKNSVKNKDRRSNSLRNTASIDIDATVRQYELLDRLRMRALQVLERILPTYLVYPTVMPSEHSPAVDRLVDQIVDIFSDVRHSQANNISAQLQPSVALCRSPDRCLRSFRRKFVRLLQLLLPNLDLTDISADEVDQLADLVISANDDDMCL